MTKRRVQGGGATSERRRRDGVSGKSHLRGFSPPCLGDANQRTACIGSFPLLKIFFRRLAATSANTLPRPSNYSIVTATGSKRSSADSDSLLCHVRLWRTSRVRFWCVSGCEHSEMRFALAICYNNTSSAAVNRATFSRWRRLARCLGSLKTKLRMPAFDNFHRMSKYKNVYEIWLMGLESLLQWEKVSATG